MPDFDAELALAGNAAGFTDPFNGAVAGSSFEIAQLEGSNPITLVLRGRAMPYRSVEFPVEQHSKITHYVGNPVATQQILGPREMATVIKGMWKARFLSGAVLVNGDPSRITSPAELVQLVEGMTRAGKAVRVQWAFEVRTGILKAFTPTFDRIQDVAWEIEFEWSGRDDEEAPKAATEASAPAGNNLLKEVAAIEEVQALAPPTALEFANGLVAEIAAVRDRATEIVDSLQQIEALVNLPAATLGAFRSSVAQLVRQLTEFERRINGSRSSAVDSRTATSVKGATNQPAAPGRNAAGSVKRSSAGVQLLQWESWRRSMARNLVNMRFRLQRLDLDVAARQQPEATRVVTAREGETLYSLATRLYGSPDFANFLAQANRLEIRDGRVVYELP